MSSKKNNKNSYSVSWQLKLEKEMYEKYDHKLLNETADLIDSALQRFCHSMPKDVVEIILEQTLEAKNIFELYYFEGDELCDLIRGNLKVVLGKKQKDIVEHALCFIYMFETSDNKAKMLTEKEALDLIYKNKPDFKKYYNPYPLQNEGEKKIIGFHYDIHLKEELDREFQEDSIAMLEDDIAKIAASNLWKWCGLNGLDNHSDLKRIKNKDTALMEMMALFNADLYASQKIEYILKVLKSEKEGYAFAKNTMKGFYEEYLGIKETKEYRYPSGSNVRLLWDNKQYCIEHDGKKIPLICETHIFVGAYCLFYRHLEPVSEWNNKTFGLYYERGRDLIHHDTIILDHYLLFNCNFGDGILFADDLERFMIFQWRDMRHKIA